MTSSFCAVHGFLSLGIEIDVVAYTRALVFSVLCVLWVYTLNVHDLRVTCNDSFSSCIDRFAAVLLVDPYVALVYATVALLVIAWRYRISLIETTPLQGTVVTAELANRGVPVKSSVRSTTVSSEIESSEEMDVHTAFRLAQENARKGPHAR
jgi:hypothetical protein